MPGLLIFANQLQSKSSATNEELLELGAMQLSLSNQVPPFIVLVHALISLAQLFWEGSVLQVPSCFKQLPQPPTTNEELDCALLLELGLLDELLGLFELLLTPLSTDDDETTLSLELELTVISPDDDEIISPPDEDESSPPPVTELELPSVAIEELEPSPPLPLDEDNSSPLLGEEVPPPLSSPPEQEYANAKASTKPAVSENFVKLIFIAFFSVFGGFGLKMVVAIGAFMRGSVAKVVFFRLWVIYRGIM